MRRDAPCCALQQCALLIGNSGAGEEMDVSVSAGRRFRQGYQRSTI